MLGAYRIFIALVTKNKCVHIKVYETHVRPLVESIVFVLAPYKQKEIIAIEKVQNNFTRKYFI